MFKLRESKLGFSLIEMMLLLLILSLMTAASVPILSRKHKKAPVKAFHGRYACFWNGNQLWQQQYSGENIIQNEAVAQCKFEAPKKANYFYIQIIGGGGGGGSAGYYRPENNSSLKVYNYSNNSAKYYVNSYSYSSSDLEDFNLTEEEFNDYVGTKYVYLSVGGTRGHYCNETLTNGNPDTDASVCYAYYQGTGRYHCVDENDDSKYYPEYDTQIKCLGLDQWNPWEPGNWGNWGFPDVNRKWVEEMEAHSCTNTRYGDAPPTAYTEAQQIKYGLHTPFITSWSSSNSYPYYYSYYRGESAGIRNSLNERVDSLLRRAAGGYGYKKYFTQDGDIITTNIAETSGGEGGEQAQCGAPGFVDGKSCTCKTSGYLEPRDGEIVKGRATAPTSSEVCTGPDTNCLKTVSTSSPAFFRYEYYQQQKMKYGMGGLAGEYKTFFARQIDPDIIISPGKGGKAGLDTSGTNSYGQKGGDSQLGNMIAEGGEGGMGDRITGYMKLPTKADDEFIENNGIKRQSGEPGAVSPFKYEANLLGINNPLEETISYSNFGSGGDGTSVTNYCWEGYYKNLFRGAFNKETGRDEDIEYGNQQPWEEVNCKAAGTLYPWTGSTSQTYGSGAGYYRGAMKIDPGDEAEDGYTGAIIISW